MCKKRSQLAIRSGESLSLNEDRGDSWWQYNSI